VLEEGWMEVGDKVTLVERKYSNWTIERVQEYLHRDKDNLEKLMEVRPPCGSTVYSEGAASCADILDSWKRSKNSEKSARALSKFE
jgi:MOSC domain-containing protein YiiM